MNNIYPNNPFLAYSPAPKSHLVQCEYHHFDDCCDDGDKSRRLALRYTPVTCSASNHSQSSGSVKCSNSGALPNADVYIVARDDKKGYTWFAGTVTVNSNFIINAATAGQSKLRPKTLIYIYSSNGG